MSEADCSKIGVVENGFICPGIALSSFRILRRSEIWGKHHPSRHEAWCFPYVSAHSQNTKPGKIELAPVNNVRVGKEGTVDKSDPITVVNRNFKP